MSVCVCKCVGVRVCDDFCVVCVCVFVVCVCLYTVMFLCFLVVDVLMCSCLQVCMCRFCTIFLLAVWLVEFSTWSLFRNPTYPRTTGVGFPNYLQRTMDVQTVRVMNIFSSLVAPHARFSACSHIHAPAIILEETPHTGSPAGNA
jgi:hypothetical protein